MFALTTRNLALLGTPIEILNADDETGWAGADVPPEGLLLGTRGWTLPGLGS